MPQLPTPSLIGMAREAAEAALTTANLAVGPITSTPDATVPSGNVLSQNPVAGASVDPGSAVSLTLSSGPAPSVVPSVVGLTREAAEAALTAAGFTIGSVTNIPSGTVPSGRVVSQDPVAGVALTSGAPVSLAFSSGVSQSVTPNLVGLTREAAEAALTAAGLTIGIVTSTAHATVASGSVVTQSPIAGAPLTPGTAVNLVVSAGRPQVAVPSLVGLSREAAEAAITSAGLTIGTVTTTSMPSGGVINEFPPAGSLLSSGSTVNLEVSQTTWYERAALAIRVIPWTNLMFFVLGLGLLAVIVGGIWSERGFLIALADEENARGLITFLIAITTVGIALILAISTIVLKSGEDNDARFDRGKQVLTMLIGVLGTIVGFYFGSAQNNDNAQAPLTVTAVECQPTSINSGTSATCSVTLSAESSGNGVVVTLASDNAAITVPNSIPVPVGTASAEFSAQAGTVTEAQKATVTATLNEAKQTAVLIVNPDAPK